MTTPTYGLIGRGRVATHLAHYLEVENQPLIRWHRGMAGQPSETLHSADTLLLAISDDAIETFLDRNPALVNRPIVHFSGSLTISRASGFHPLMTFGPDLYDRATYRGIPFIGELGGPEFRKVFPGLENPSRALDPKLKSRYHALCVLAGNFTTILWSKAMQDFEENLGLPRDLLGPFLERTAANTIELGPEALTGSLDRGEEGTIVRDLEGLAGDPYRAVYLAVANAIAGREVRS